MRTKIILILVLTFACTITMLYPGLTYADIYKFVTIDGVESFTDIPQDAAAKLIIRDVAPKIKKTNTINKQKQHEVSLQEIAEKAVQASLNPQIPDQNRIEPRLPPVGGTITSGVGMRIDPIDGKWRQHNGIDIAIPTGTPITAVAPGVVIYSGLRSGYGYTVLVEHINGMITLYAHNSALQSTVGQQVDSTTVIALSGNTGRSTGPHLHFEAWQNGINVTHAFMPGSTVPIPAATKIASNRVKALFRKEILSDGSVLFTNLP